jgi:hypothetical protein
MNSGSSLNGGKKLSWQDDSLQKLKTKKIDSKPKERPSSA